METTLPYTKGLHAIGKDLYAYLQPNGSWGWSNAGLIVDGKQSLLVDTLYDLILTAEMLESMKRTTPAAERIETVVNTHAHGDHTYGNQLIEGAEIVSSRKSYEEILHDTPPQFFANMLAIAPTLGNAGAYFQRIYGPFKFDDITVTPPTRTFDGELNLKVGSKEVHLFEVGPAHTAGDTLAYAPSEDVVFTGDILFIGGHPIMWTGPVGNWIKACDKILSLKAHTIVPGHGPITDDAGVLRVKQYLEYLAEEARKRYDKGMDAFEAAKDIPLTAYATWTDAERIVVTVNSLYREFSGDSSPNNLLEVFLKMSEVAKV